MKKFAILIFLVLFLCEIGIAGPYITNPGGGSGDMTKAVYDTNADNVVDSAASATTATTVTVSDNQTDTTEFPLLSGAATGNLGPRTRSTLTYNAATGLLSSPLLSAGGGGFSVDASGNVTGASYSTTRGAWPQRSQFYESTEDTGSNYWVNRPPDHAAGGMTGDVVNITPADNGAVGQTQVITAISGDNQTNDYAYTNSITITQASHGFAVGDVVKRSSGSYAKAQADSAANAEVVGIVSSVPSSGVFVLTSHGYVTGLTGLTDATVYYLSPSSAGAITATQPSTAGQVIKPVLIANGTTTGYFYNMRGSMVSTSGSTDVIGATFDGGGSAIAVNTIVYDRLPYNATVNQWTVVCDQDSGTNGIVITPYKDAYVEDTLPTTTMCASGSAPHTSGGATAGGTMHSADWDCNVTTITAGDVIGYKVTTAPSSATRCTLSLKITKN